MAKSLPPERFSLRSTVDALRLDQPIGEKYVSLLAGRKKST